MGTFPLFLYLVLVVCYPIIKISFLIAIRPGTTSMNSVSEDKEDLLALANSLPICIFDGNINRAILLTKLSRMSNKYPDRGTFVKMTELHELWKRNSILPKIKYPSMRVD